MMDAYQSLSGFYDSLTTDIPYEAFADYYESVFQQHPGEFRMLLDLCCGTGTLTRILALRGYEMIAADASEEMLMQAREKCADLPMPPLFLCQEAAELDLYGTVDAAVCSLDGMNYLSPEELPEVFHRLHLFIRPGGMLIFDIRSPESFAALDGGIWVDETEEVFCLWRSEFDPEERIMYYDMDLFSPEGELWKREQEEHIEYAHDPEFLKQELRKAGFSEPVFTDQAPQGDQGRRFVISIREE